MIRDFEVKDEEQIMELGKYLNGSFKFDAIYDNEKIAVYEEDGKIIGFIDYIKMYELIEILYVVVEEEFRRCGIASKLFEYVYKNNDYKRSILEVKSTNEGAIRFYQSLGFVPIRIIKNYTVDGIDAISMEKVKG